VKVALYAADGMSNNEIAARGPDIAERSTLHSAALGK
jgi:hypothetical protein